MQGSQQNPGIVQRAVTQIFKELKRREDCLLESEVTISCYEIHIETVRDLFNVMNQQSQLMTNQWKWAPNTITVRSETEVNQLLAKAYSNRSIGATNLNEMSSRSHCIYQLKISATPKEGERINGSLNLVDLAGSENINASGVVGERKEEATAINRHLTALKDVISALLQGQKYVPYRNSKLTHLLS